MKKVLLDTNFLFIPMQFKVDIFSEIERLMRVPYELCMIDMSLDELESLTTRGSGKDKTAAKLGLALVKSKNIKILDTGRTEKHLNTDKMIVEVAKSPDFVVATQDKALKRDLKENNVPVIVLRQKRYLVIVPEL
jgi:rRNA-processing protein FCF1